MLVKVAVAVFLPPDDEPADDVHAAMVAAAVTAATGIHRIFSLREFMNTCSGKEGYGVELGHGRSGEQ